MKNSLRVGRWTVLAAVTAAVMAGGFGCGGRPTINERFPLKKPDQLSPPIVYNPIHECAQVVHVSGFVPHATVKVQADGVEVGSATPDFAFADIPLTQALKKGQSVTATQTVAAMTSPPSVVPVIVSAYPLVAGGFNKPVVGADIYACGRIVPVDKCVPSTVVHVFQNGMEIGAKPTPDPWVPVFTLPLIAGQQVTALLIACEMEPDLTIKSPPSDPVTVQPAPNPMPKPSVRADSLIVGNTAVTLDGLYTGAAVTVYSNGAPVGGGYATGASNWCPIDPPLASGATITATQELCGVTSDPSDPVKPTNNLKAPVVLAPICPGQYVIIRDTVVNATVVVLRNGSVAGYGGATGGDLVLALSAPLNPGDTVTAVQYMGSVISPTSNVVTVSSSLRTVAVEVFGGEPFFVAESGEQSIDGPVFPRGRGGGPFIRVRTCCGKKASITVTGPGGEVVAEPATTEHFPGFFTAQWDWSNQPGWAVPGGIPIGRYLVRVETDCGEERPADVPFYVIFNPADVGGPGRFSFNELCVWFGTLQNGTRALPYHLHPDDRRIFRFALDAAAGATDPATAAQKICDAEENRFDYSLNYHTDDVISLLENFDEAQCADDACFLTALLRAVGIPAHTASADAALETGDANWTFDTWTEFLVPAPGGGAAGTPEWLILHPHEYPDMNPESRATFGGNRGVAVKSFNDLVVMADENWVAAEVNDSSADALFGRNDCQEPVESIAKKGWVFELCENGYWNPNHWDCASLGARGLRRHSAFRLDVDDVRFGGKLSGEVSLINPGRPPAGRPGAVFPPPRRAAPADDDAGGAEKPEPAAAEGAAGGNGAEAPAAPGAAALDWAVEVVGDLPESKQFPDDVFDAAPIRPQFGGGAGAAAAVVVPFNLRLPQTLRPGYELYLRVRRGNQTVSVQALRLPDGIRAELSGAPKALRVGDEFRLTAALTNRTGRAVTAVDASLSLPPGLELRKGKAAAKFERVRGGGGAAKLTWTVRAVAPLEAGTIRLSVATADGGGAVATAPVVVGGGTPAGASPLAPVQRRERQ